MCMKSVCGVTKLCVKIDVCEACRHIETKL